MVNTDINDKFKSFYLRQQNINKKKQFQNTPFIVDHAYFVQFQDWEKAHDSQDLTFIPFAKKMSEYVKDCTELSKKISDKEDGYKTGGKIMKKATGGTTLKKYLESQKISMQRW